MKPGPAAALACLEQYVEIDAAPRHAREVLRDIVIGEQWQIFDDLEEVCERWGGNFLSKVQNFLNNAYNLGTFQSFEINSSNSEYIQGSCFCSPQDTEELRLAKRNRSNTILIYNHIRKNSDSYLEKVCLKVLSLLGVTEPQATPRSGDGGVDFYGSTDFGFILKPEVLPAGAERHMRVWFVGQAKKYNDNNISTKEIRELVGSTHLARAKLYSGTKDPMLKFSARLCDPIFSIFVTTGRFSEDSVSLMRKSGIIPMDGPQLGQFLADHGVGLENQIFVPENFDRWIAS